MGKRQKFESLGFQPPLNLVGIYVVFEVLDYKTRSIVLLMVLEC